MNKLVQSFLLFLYTLNGSGQTTNYNDSIKLLGYFPAPCNSLDADRLLNRIISKTFLEDTLYLQIGFSANCCFEFLPNATYKDNFLTIELSTLSQETICECNCCYEMTLIFTGVQSNTFKVILLSEEIFLTNDIYQTLPEKFEIHDGDTINRINKYGHKVGVWKYYNDSLKYLEKIIYYDGLNENDMLSTTGGEGYYPDGTIKWKSYIDLSNCFYQSPKSNDFWEKIQYGFTFETYFQNGKLKSQSTTVCKANSFDYLYRYWNKKGKEIKNRNEK